MPVLVRIRHAAEYVVGTALVLVHLALSGRRVALVELLESPPPATRDPGTAGEPRAAPPVSRASG